MECLVAALDEEDFSHIEFDDSELGYKIGVRKATAKTSSGSTDEVSLMLKKYFGDNLY